MPGFNVTISAETLGQIVWRQWLQTVEHELPAVRVAVAEAFDACEKTRPLMAYNTGSISFASALALYAAVRNLEPQTIFELGTFIGKSTSAMALAADRNGHGRIYTCDGSNDFHLPPVAKCPIQPFPRARSTDALLALAKAGERIDLAFIDGRLSPQDVDILSRLLTERAVVALDDFEGMEKGVANLMLLRAHKAFAGHVLAHPPGPSVLAGFGSVSRSVVALLVPVAGFRFTPQ
ncbi:MAG: class I SAM-dependent methyltransferase [Rhodospirillales bacterium]|jgi:predicted O-methyltransferase YrrM